MITRQNILRHELTGLDVRVEQAQNHSLNGITGLVVLETRNMIYIRTRAGVKKGGKKRSNLPVHPPFRKTRGCNRDGTCYGTGKTHQHANKEIEAHNGKKYRIKRPNPRKGL